MLDTFKRVSYLDVCILWSKIASATKSATKILLKIRLNNKRDIAYQDNPQKCNFGFLNPSR